MNHKTYSLCFVLDRDGEINLELLTSNSLYKLDQSIKRFSNDKVVRQVFDEEIGEFCLNYKEKIEEENKKNHHNRTGSIVILEKTYNENNEIVFIRPMKVIYDGYLLPPRRSCIYKIKVALEDDENLKKLFYSKGYLLTKEERAKLWRYLNENNEYYYEEFIQSFTGRIATSKSWYAYWVCRMLANLCDLIVKETKTDFSEDAYGIRLDDLAYINKDVDEMMGQDVTHERKEGR